MAFREVRVFEIREVLRLWLRGEGFRSIERLGPVDVALLFAGLAGVRDVCVVGGPDAVRGETPVAFVVPDREGTNRDPDGIYPAIWAEVGARRSQSRTASR